MVFLDHKKAFDTVDHDILCCKFLDISLSNSTIDWFDSYLNNRQQVTKVGIETSSADKISCWMPQGSILGSLLFVIQINNLPNLIEECETFLYADDMAIIATGADENEVSNKLSQAMIASQWLDDDKLSLNISKTKCMYMGTAGHVNRVA